MQEKITPDEQVNDEALPESNEVEQQETEQEIVSEPAEHEQPQDDYEERARKQGWKPKEEYGGNEKYWVDAEQYVKNAEESLPIARGTIRKLETEISDMKNSFEKMKKFSEMQIETARQKALDEIKQKQIKAIDEDGVDAATALSQYESDKLRIDKQYTPEPEATPQRQIPYEVQDWIQANPWASKNDAVGYVAQKYEQEIGRANPHMTAIEVLEAVKRKVIQEFPNKFQNPKRQVPSIEGGGTVKTNNKSKTRFTQLPYDVQKDAQKLIRSGDYKDEAEFMKDYELYFKE